MGKTSYQRSLILLHRLESGYGGHIRAERRACSAALGILVNGTDCTCLTALLISTGKGACRALPLGELTPDGDGQARLNAVYDPRSAKGRSYEDCPLLVIARKGKASCRLLLFGELHGCPAIDWSKVREAVAAALLPQEDVSEDDITSPEIQIKVKAVLPAVEEADDSQAVEPRPSADDGQDPPAAPWPEEIACLQPLFAAQPEITPFPAEGYHFIEAPLPPETGWKSCAVGLCFQDNRPISVCYALPAARTPEPPPGLEGYRWYGEGQSGWWAVFLDAVSGEEIEPPEAGSE